MLGLPLVAMRLQLNPYPKSQHPCSEIKLVQFFLGPMPWGQGHHPTLQWGNQGIAYAHKTTGADRTAAQNCCGTFQGPRVSMELLLKRGAL